MKFSIVTILFHAVGDLAVLGARQRHKTQIKVGGLMVGFAIFEIEDQVCVCCHQRCFPAVLPLPAVLAGSYVCSA